MPSDRPGLADQDQERGLERILGVVAIAEHGSARAQNHRAVPLDQGGKRSLVARGEKAFEELAVGKAGQNPVREQSLNLS